MLGGGVQKILLLERGLGWILSAVQGTASEKRNACNKSYDVVNMCEENIVITQALVSGQYSFCFKKDNFHECRYSKFELSLPQYCCF